MRRPSAVPSSLLRFELLESRLVPSASFSNDPSENAWIRQQIKLLETRPEGTDFRNQWKVILGQGQDGKALAQSLGAVQLGVGTYGAPEWQFVSGASSADQYLTLTRAADEGKLQNFVPVMFQTRQVRLVPNDALYDQQWHLNNTGQTGGKAGADVNIEKAWDVATGRGVVIAVIDDGVQYLHPDLRDRVFVNPGDPGDPFRVNQATDRINNDRDGFFPTDANNDGIPDTGLDLDDNGVDDALGFVDNFVGWDFNDDDNSPVPDISTDFHGTAVTGLAVAEGNNKIGVVGTAFNARFIPIRFVAGPTTDGETAAALTLLNKYIGVSSNSWGPTTEGTDLSINAPEVNRALRETAINGRDGKGTSIVFAAGNGRLNADNTNYNQFNNSRYVISVGALNHDGTFAFYSTPGASLFVSAPAGPAGPNDPDTTRNLTTTDLFGPDGYNDGSDPTVEQADPNYTQTFNGTSAAAPVVSGVIALMLEANPNLTYRDVQAILAETSSSQNDPGRYQANGADFLVSEDYGFGVIDAEAAVNRAKSWVNLGPEITAGSGNVEVARTLPDSFRGVDFDSGVRTGKDVPVSKSVEFFSNVRIEWATLRLDADISARGDLGVQLTSPSGLVVNLALARVEDTNPDYDNYTFTTPFFWGELARGKWTVTLTDRINSKADGLTINEGIWNDFELNFFGSEVPSSQALPVSPPVVIPDIPDPIPGLGDFNGGDNGVTDPTDVLPRTPGIAVSVPFSGTVQVLDPANGGARLNIQPYGPGYTGNISVAMADVNGDGFLDLITGAGAGAGPHVKVFDGTNGAEIASFFAYDPSFRGGVNVAGGDTNGDGFAEIIVAAGPGGGPHIRTFSGSDFTDLGSFMAYDPNFRGGSTVSAGDVNGDGRADYFVGAGFGGGPHVYIFNGVSKAVISTFFAYDSTFRNGVNVAAGDVTGDGLADLITGPGLGGGPDVRAFDIAGGSKVVRGFFATDPNGYNAGLRVVARDVNGDKIADIITAPVNGSAPIRQFNGVDSTLLTELSSNSLLGLFVG